MSQSTASLVLPGIKLQSVVIPGLSEVAVDAEHLLELINGPNVADGEVEDHLHGLPRAVHRPHLLVVILLNEQVIQCIGNLKCDGGP